MASESRGLFGFHKKHDHSSENQEGGDADDNPSRYEEGQGYGDDRKNSSYEDDYQKPSRYGGATDENDSYNNKTSAVKEEDYESEMKASKKEEHLGESAALNLYESYGPNAAKGPERGPD